MPIPDRWLNYKPIGERIEGTRFIAFKVPLREQITESIQEDERFDNVILLKKIPSIGLIIDLTNTHRYYNPTVFEREGVEYFKLMIPGHETPRTELVEQFKSHVVQFLKNNKSNDKLIGVHCTHGVNRTGYFICNYMISEMTIEPKEAIKRFDSARGHKIERQNYIQALYNLCGSTSVHSEGSTPSTYKSWRERPDSGHCSTYFRNVQSDRNHFNKSREAPYVRSIEPNNYQSLRAQRDPPNIRTESYDRTAPRYTAQQRIRVTDYDYDYRNRTHTDTRNTANNNYSSTRNTDRHHFNDNRSSQRRNMAHSYNRNDSKRFNRPGRPLKSSDSGSYCSRSSSRNT